MRETVETRAGDRPDIATRCAVCLGPCVVAGVRDLYSANVPALAWSTAGDVAATYTVAVRPEHETDAGAVPVCDPCVALAARWAIADGRPAVGYVNADGTAVTSWGGAHVARIVRSTTFRSYLHGGRPGDKVLAWSAVLPSGAKCYGRNGGRGMVTNIRSAVRHA